MNGLDYAIVFLVSMAAFHGLSRGALRMLTPAASLIAGIYLASLFYRQAADLIGPRLGGGPAANTAAGYLAVFALVFAAAGLAGNYAARLLHVARMGWADCLLGGAIGAALAGVAAGAGVTLLTTLLPSGSALLRHSQLAPKLLVYNRELVRYIPEELKRTYELRRAQLMRYWIEEQARLAVPAAAPETSPAPAGRPR